MDNEKKYIVGIGEALWDCFPEGKKLGGAPANFAFHVSQHGLNGIAVSAVGDDELGHELIDTLKYEDMEYYIPTVNYPTGTVQVTLNERGVPQYEICENVAWDNVEFTPELQDLARSCQAVCFGSLAQRNSVTRNTIKRFVDAMPKEGVLRVFDINLRQAFYSKEIIESSIDMSNVLKINDEELEVVTPMLSIPMGTQEERCKALLAKYPALDILILTCGEEGSHIFTREIHTFVSTPKVKVASTVGAGDSFTATFVAGILSGLNVADAHYHAVMVSAHVCTHDGAMPQLPHHLKCNKA
ncbi:MAG: carbohydrate kinase [Muribaculaceae bacterium]|nr:carbohydrate kinase [Muribaculaceae bacterium]